MLDKVKFDIGDTVYYLGVDQDDDVVIRKSEVVYLIISKDLIEVRLNHSNASVKQTKIFASPKVLLDSLLSDFNGKE